MLSFFRGVLLSLARHHSLLNLFISSCFHFSLPFFGSIHEVQCISNQIFLDVSVERSVSCETGSVVDFEEIRIEFMINHNIKSQNFKAHVIGKVIRVHVGDRGTQDRITCDDSLNKKVVYFLLQLIDVVPILCYFLIDRCERSLVANIHVLHIFVEDKVRTVLVDGVVGEVHEFVV